MSNLFKKNAFDRIVDANINRAKEGLRVCEEITRFVLNSRALTTELKDLRHRIDLILKRLSSRSVLIRQRDSSGDVGKNIYADELKRKNLKDIFFANCQRVKESIRVLEEFSKLKDVKVAVDLKEIRYRVYEIEKKVTGKIASLRNYR